MDFRFCTECNIFYFTSLRNIFLCDRLWGGGEKYAGISTSQSVAVVHGHRDILLPTFSFFFPKKIPKAAKGCFAGEQHKHCQRIPENLMIYFEKSRQLFCNEIYWRSGGREGGNRNAKKRSVNEKKKKRESLLIPVIQFHFLCGLCAHFFVV